MKTGPKYKICRRLGSRVFGKCQTTKFSISGSSRSGTGGRSRSPSDYGLQLIEKQKVRYTYGLKERQLAGYVNRVRAKRVAGEAVGSRPADRLFQTLESRLDNVVFRLGLALSRAMARQLVSHGHIEVNGSRVNIPAYQVKVGDEVTVRGSSRALAMFRADPEQTKERQPPAWLLLDQTTLKGQVLARPTVSEAPAELDFRTIFEFYSRV